MKFAISAISFVLLAGTAYAQTMPGQQPQQNPSEAQLNTEWGAYQLSQQHVSTAIVKIIEEWRKDRAALESERKYWAEYVKGLETVSKPKPAQ